MTRLSFFTTSSYPTAKASGDERLRVNSDGSIRIMTANGQLKWIASSGNDPFIRSIGSGQQSLEFNTGGDERLRITETGSFLVGTTTDGVGRFAFYNPGSSGGDSTYVKDMGLYVRNDCGPTDVDLLGVDNFTMKIHNGAYAGTGIANPQGTMAKLLFHGASHNGWNNYGALCLDVVGTSGGRGDFVFIGGSNERMRIRYDGGVTIGDKAGMSANASKNVAGARLAIDCQGRNIYSGTTNVANYGLAFHNDPTTDNANGIGFFNDDGTTIGGYIVHQDKGGSNSGDIVFGTSSTSSVNNPVERMRINNEGQVLVNTANVYVGGKFSVRGGMGNSNTGYAMVEYGKGANGTFTSVVIDFTVGGGPSTVIFETQMYGYNIDWLDSLIGTYGSYQATMRQTASSGTSIALSFQ